ncbi:tyrosine protein phosphatase [Rhizobium sp. AC44/96]|uniref:dual specificity protein phosphatase family protein n=1 Tax=Rhizobium sp. AC44/96 TaxID=1841654 RepID=UPI00080F7914|nr:dual specificity protein phosphatase family protein [Rhizobium sp. AC44/96]OCJ02690.1 tyrosine protein phosphatase [Rhizobium sp. AC44/96]
MKLRVFAFLKWPVWLVCAAVVLTLAHAGIAQLSGNFHEVIPGELYRSAQPTGADINAYSKTYGIKTILNLRDEKRTGWYREEAQAAARNGITLIDFPISSSKELPRDEAKRLAKLMADAPKPLLIHCEHGANRTGLASAIYVGAVNKGSEAFAEFQLSPYFGHFAIPGVGRYEMYRSWDDYEETIGF